MTDMTTRQAINDWLETARIRNLIIAVILVNAVLLGMETSQALMARFGPVIKALDIACLTVFVVELGLRIFAQGRGFVRSGWNIFDFVIIAVSITPGGQSMSVLRALRILRVLRVISAAPRLRRVVEGFLSALPGMGSVVLLMSMIFYIGAVLSTQLFGAQFPEWFGTLGRSAYSLFQIMTLESWSMGIVRPVMVEFAYAWAFFVPFILVTTFAVVNLLVGLIVNSMHDAHNEEEKKFNDAYREEVLARLGAIEARVTAPDGRSPPLTSAPVHNTSKT